MPAATSSHEETIYRVDDLILNVARGCVTRGSVVVPLSPLSFELLLALVRAAPDVLSLDSIMDQVWPGMVVSPETVSQRVKLVRDALGDRAAAPRYIAGVRGRGYRIVAPVSHVMAAEPAVTTATGNGQQRGVLIAAVLAAVLLSAATLWWRLGLTGDAMHSPAQSNDAISPQSVAVLPFENLSADKDNAYFASGMQDMVLTKLAGIGGLKVISRTSTADFKSHPGDVRTIGQELGVANLLEGSVQKVGNQVLIDVQLIDARNAHHLWAQSYRRTLQNIFGIEGEVAEKVAMALKARLSPAEQDRVVAIATHDPAAYDAYLRGVSLQVNTSVALPGPEQTIAGTYRRAVQLDKGFALAWARLSSILSLSYFNYVYHTPAQLVEAKNALDRALALAPDDAATRIAQGDYAYYGHNDYANALVAYRKALQTAPNNTSALAQIGYVERRQGHWQSSIHYQERALTLDPRNVQILSALGRSYWTLCRYDRAEEIFQEALAVNPQDPGVTSELASLYQSEGYMAHADQALAGVKISPNDWLNFRPKLWQALLKRHYGDTVRILQKALATKSIQDGSRGYYYQQLGYVESLMGKREASHRAYRKAITVLQRPPQWPPMFGVLGLAQAGLGEKDAALNSSRHAIMLENATHDAYGSPICEYFLAATQVQVGELEQAVATLQKLLAEPPGSSLWGIFLTPELLRLDPVWDPLRTNPDFQALLAQYPTSHAAAG